MYYREWVGWHGTDGQVYYLAGQWLAYWDGFPGIQGWGYSQNADGSWTAMAASWGSSPEHESHVYLSWPGTYWAGAEYYWGPFAGFDGAGHFEWLGAVTCS